MATIQQRFEIERPLYSVYQAVSHPLEILESLPAVRGVRLVSDDLYRFSVGPVDHPQELELQIVSRTPPQTIAWRTADGQHSGSVTLEALGPDRTGVSIQSESTASENDAPSASAIHDALQAFKRALQTPHVRITRGGAAQAQDPLTAATTAFRRYASDWRSGRAAISQSIEYPFAIMRQLSRQVDRVFGDVLRATPVARFPEFIPGMPWNPKVEVCEQCDQVRVCVDVPGVNEANLEVEIEDGTLVIRGERQDERAQEQGRRRSEVHYGRFTRRVPLPEGIDKDGARAILRNGVLEIRIPLHRPQPRKVPVEHAT